MQYEQFTQALARGLEDAGLRPIGSGEESLNPKTLERVRTLYVEPTSRCARASRLRSHFPCPLRTR